METLTSYLEKEGVTAASISAIGAVENAEVCFYDLPSKSYICKTMCDPHEVLSMSGNVTFKDGQPFVHAHVTLSNKEGRVSGGHLKEAAVAVTLEVTVLPVSGECVRNLDEAIGLFLLPPTT